MANIIESSLNDYVDDVKLDGDGGMIRTTKLPDGVKVECINANYPMFNTTTYARPGNITIIYNIHQVCSMDVHSISKVEKEVLSKYFTSFMVYKPSGDRVTFVADDDTAKRIFETAGRPELIQ